jgi:hypothetical protein
MRSEFSDAFQADWNRKSSNFHAQGTGQGPIVEDRKSRPRYVVTAGRVVVDHTNELAAQADRKDADIAIYLEGPICAM